MFKLIGTNSEMEALTSSHLCESVFVSACVINYNGEAYLEETLKGIVSQLNQFREIILVDNASEDASLKIAEKFHPDVKIIRMRENCGPGAARNMGFKSAACDKILMLDNDIILAPDCAEKLLQALWEFPSAAMAIPSVRYSERRDIIQYEGAGCHYLGLMSLHHQDMLIQAVSAVPRKVNSLVTACFAVDRSKIGKNDPFDESFFFNLEDHDLGVRTRILGDEIITVPASVCYHRGGSTGLSYRKGKPYPRQRIFFLIRNRWQIILKHFHWKTLLFLGPMLVIYEIFQFAGLAKKKCLVDWLRSVGWTLRQLPEIARKRRLIQRARKTPDREILDSGPIPLTGAFVASTLEREWLLILNRVTEGYWHLVKRFI